MSVLKFAAATAVAAVLGLSVNHVGEAHAAATSEYERYHASIKAVERCRGVSFSQEEHNRLAERIRELVGPVPQDSLSQLVSGNSMMERKTQFRPRCENEDVQAALDRFDRDLRPALQ